LEPAKLAYVWTDTIVFCIYAQLIQLNERSSEREAFAYFLVDAVEQLNQLRPLTPRCIYCTCCSPKRHLNSVVEQIYAGKMSDILL